MQNWSYASFHYFSELKNLGVRLEVPRSVHTLSIRQVHFSFKLKVISICKYVKYQIKHSENIVFMIGLEFSVSEQIEGCHHNMQGVTTSVSN